MLLDAESTALVLDTASDLEAGSRRYPNWRVVPLKLAFGDESYRDFVDLTPVQLYRRLRETSDFPTTSVPSPAEFTEVFQELASYARVYGLHPSAKVSGTYNSSTLAADETGGRVVTVDTETVSGTIVLLGDAIQRRLERGTSDDEIGALVDRFRARAAFVYTLETLEYLARGGRIGKVQAIAGGLLNTRPLVAMRDGVNVPAGRARGRERALALLEREFLDATVDAPTLHFGVSHADVEDEARAFAERLRAQRQRASFDVLAQIAPALGSHLGPGTIGVFWFDDS
jgi:DegV family protein with EDD domain